MTKLTRAVEIHPGWDKPADGIHGAEVVFVLRGPAGAVTFACYTTWLPKETQEKYKNGWRTNTSDIQPVPMDLTVHSPARLESMNSTLPRTGCPYMEGNCYSKVSNSAATGLRDVLLKEGSDGVWRDLMAHYRSMFGVAAARHGDQNDTGVPATEEK